jgi:hypothetical protein
MDATSAPFIETSDFISATTATTATTAAVSTYVRVLWRATPVTVTVTATATAATNKH